MSISRQQRRRAVMKGAQRLLKDVNKKAAAAELAAMRERRSAREKLTGRPTIVQGPGKLMSSVRPFKKPHGQPNWRARDLTVMPNGDAIPAGLEATSHATKGLRVFRTKVAA